MRKSGARIRHALMHLGACVPWVGLALCAGIAYGQGTAEPGGQGTASPSQVTASPSQGTAIPAALQPFHATINTICDKCHNTTDWAGGFAFDTLDLSRPVT